MPELTESEIQSFLTALEEAKDVTTPEFIETHKEIAFKLIEQRIRSKIEEAVFITGIGRLRFYAWNEDYLSGHKVPESIFISNTLLPTDSPLKDKLSAFFNTDLIKTAATKKNEAAITLLITKFANYTKCNDYGRYSGCYPYLLMRHISKLSSNHETWSSFFRRFDYERTQVDILYAYRDMLLDADMKSILSWPESQEYMMDNNSQHATNIQMELVQLEKKFKEIIRKNIIKEKGNLCKFAIEYLKKELARFNLKKDTDVYLDTYLTMYAEHRVRDVVTETIRVQLAVQAIIRPEKIAEFKKKIKERMPNSHYDPSKPHPTRGYKNRLNSIYIEYKVTFYNLCKKELQAPYEVIEHVVDEIVRDAFNEVVAKHEEAMVEFCPHLFAANPSPKKSP